jgi:hemoglobin
MQNQLSPYEALGGEAGVQALAAAFYNAMDRLPQAQDIRKMHGASLDLIKAKLAAYLSGWLGGPLVYLERFGPMCLGHAHEPYEIGSAERDQWMLCMDAALEEIGAPVSLREPLHKAFHRLASALRTVED